MAGVRNKPIFPIEGFSGGLVLNVDPTQMGKTSLLVGTNIDLTRKVGEAPQRLGWTRITSAHGATSYAPNAMFHHDGKLFLAKWNNNAGQIVRFQMDGTLTAIGAANTGGPQTFAALPNQKMIFAANGVEIGTILYGDNYESAMDWGAMFRTLSPDITVTATGSGSLSAANAGWKYLFSYWSDKTATRSEFYPLSINMAPNPKTTGTFSSVEKVVVANLPADIPNAEYTHIEVWRTQDNGSEYYRVARLKEGTTSYNDTMTDATLILGEIMRTNSGVPVWGPPICGKYTVAYRSMLLVTGDVPVTAGTVSIVASDATVTGTATSWDNGIYKKRFHDITSNWWGTVHEFTDATHFELSEAPDSTHAGNGHEYEIIGYPGMVYVSDTDDGSAMNYIQSIQLETNGETNTGMATLHDEAIVWSKSTMHAITGLDYTNLSSRVISKTIGCVGPYSVAYLEEPDAIVWRGSEGWYIYDGTEPRLISQALRPAIQPSSAYDPEYASACFLKKKQQLWIAEYRPSDGACRIFVQHRDPTIGSMPWTEYDSGGLSVTAMLSFWDDTTNSERMVLADDGGHLYEVEIDDQYADHDQNDTTYSGTATGGSTTTIVDTGASFPATGANPETGLELMNVRRVRSPGASQTVEYSVCTGSTSTQLTVSPAFSDATVAGDTYQVGTIRVQMASGHIPLGGHDMYFRVPRVYIGRSGTSSSAMYYDFAIVIDRQADSTAIEHTVSTATGNQNDIVAIGRRFRHVKYSVDFGDVNVSDWGVQWIHINFAPGGAHV